MISATLLLSFVAETSSSGPDEKWPLVQRNLLMSDIIICHFPLRLWLWLWGTSSRETLLRRSWRYCWVLWRKTYMTTRDRAQLFLCSRYRGHSAKVVMSQGYGSTFVTFRQFLGASLFQRRCTRLCWRWPLFQWLPTLNMSDCSLVRCVMWLIMWLVMMMQSCVLSHWSKAVLQFVMDYPLGKKLNRYLDFYITNLW